MTGLTKDELKKYHRSMVSSYQRLSWVRKWRTNVWREILGKHYGEQSKKDRVPIGRLGSAISIYKRKLVNGVPRVIVTHRDPKFNDEAWRISEILNQELEDIHFDEETDDVVLDAITHFGQSKLGLKDSGMIMWNERPYRKGSLCFKRIDLDDAVIDAHSKGPYKWRYIGDTYRVPKSYLKRFDSISKKAYSELEASGPDQNNPDGTSRLEGMAVGGYQRDIEVEPMVTLRDVYLPDRNWFYTQECKEDARVLVEFEWGGAEMGPYNWLTYGISPNSAIPRSPTMAIIDLHVGLNMLYNKLFRQAEGQKTITVAWGQPEDAKAIREAQDGDTVMLLHPDTMKQVMLRGIDQVNFAFFLDAEKQLDWEGGNLSTMGGRQSIADTLGQEQMLSQESGVYLEELRDRTMGYLKPLLKEIAIYLYEDPVRVYNLVRRVDPGDDSVSLPFQWHPSERKSPIREFKFAIDLYSLVPKTAEQQLRDIVTMFQQVIYPSLQIQQQQGVSIDWPEVYKTLAELSGIPDLVRFVQYNPEQGMMQGQEEGSGKANNTTRNYVRKNVPGASGGAREQLQKALLSGNMRRSA